MAHRRAGRKRRFSDQTPVVQSEQPLKELLCDLATVLLPLGITPRALSDISREAFVLAAAATAKLRNGKINQSRVSAQTGLTRAHVRQILSGSARHLTALRGRAPIELAANGWRNDRAFTGPSGKPKRLPIAGPEGSFAALARKYAPDVPHRALLRELERTGLTIVRGGQVHLRSSRIESRQRVLTPTRCNRLSKGAIHRFTFSRGDATDPRTGRDEFRRLANLLSAFKQDTKAGLRRSSKSRGHGTLFVLTLILSEPETRGRDVATRR
jgi:hypothetical protein